MMRRIIKKFQYSLLLLVMMILSSGLFQECHAAEPGKIKNIIFGLYGDLTSKKASTRFEVTDKLKSMLKSGKIKGKVVEKAFGVDPAKGKHKGLFLVYKAEDGRLFCRVKSGNGSLSFPDARDVEFNKGHSGSSDLQILQAFYGDLNRTKSDKAVINVTARVQALVKNGKLDIAEKHKLFGDVAKGKDLGLFILYRVRDKVYAVIFGDGEKGSISNVGHENAYQVYTFKKHTRKDVTPSVVSPTPATDVNTARESAALAMFPEGTKVVLMSYADQERPHLLQVGKKGELEPKGLDPKDPSAQFIVGRSGNWISFKSVVTGEVLQVLPRLHMVRLAKDGAPEWAQWSAEFDDPAHSYSIVYLKNRASGGYLSAPAGAWTLGRMWTTLKERVDQALTKGAVLPSTDPAAKSNEGRLKIFAVDDLIKTMESKSGKSLPGKVVDKVVDVVRELEPLNAIPGGHDFSYSPIIHGMKSKYHDNWKFATPGSGSVVFDARTRNRMIITLSSVPRDLDNGMYRVSIGHENNTRSGITKSTSGAMLFEKDVTKGASKDIVVTGGLPGDGSTFDSYWIKVDQGTISFGKGRAVGQNEQMRWTDPDPVKLVSYVGFGGGKLNRVHYKNIEINGAGLQPKPAQDSATTAVLPADFNAEQIKAQSVAAGLRDGQLELFAVIDHELYYRERGSMATKPWKKVDAKEFTKVRYVSAAPNDGTLYVVTMDGNVLRYNWPQKSVAPVAVPAAVPTAAPVKKVVKKARSKKRASARKKVAGKKKSAKSAGKKAASKKKRAKTSRAGAKRKVAKKKSARKSAKKRVKKAAATPQ
ncbi:hypothetical protein JST56_07505 [Candidatus Dependentiae bacterium]|nr:hypothetical protein [Candidatus Dependentiae bacterium]